MHSLDPDNITRNGFLLLLGVVDTLHDSYKHLKEITLWTRTIYVAVVQCIVMTSGLPKPPCQNPASIELLI